MNSPLQNSAWRHRKGCLPALGSTSGAERVSYETESAENILNKLQNRLMKLSLDSNIWCINDSDDLWADLKAKQNVFRRLVKTSNRENTERAACQGVGRSLGSAFALTSSPCPPPSPDFLEPCAKYIAIATFSSSQVCTSLGVQNGTWHLTFSEVARVAKGLSRGLKLLGKGAWEAEFLLHNLSPVPHVIGSDA
jgi:hypothetical protein